ncbi:hypothetical protein LCGC14_0449070 [marine sediment metagenome]|uniref:Uncharacterized protein n=1 Tax=marine sediment metagenome TaxID=412755 RepID=A0A0F9V5A1_9ZZZZ
MVTAKEKILDLPRPLTDNLSDIGDDLGVSRQYVHQVVTEEKIPYVVRGIKEEKICLNSECTNLTSYPDRDAFCDLCSPNSYELRRKGEWVKCTLCKKQTYRCQSELTRTKKIFCSTECYNKFRQIK